MESIGVWLSPLLLLPGAAMLILSTSARYAEIHNELHLFLNQDQSARNTDHRPLLRRATLFRNALVCLYIAVVFLALGGLLGGLTSSWTALSVRVVVVLTCIGIFMLLAGAWFLVYESVASLSVIRYHIDQLDQQGSDDLKNGR